MLPKFRLVHRLLLIFLVSFVSVAVLAYSLIVEKSIAIEFAQKELRGNAYVAVVRSALLAVITDQLAAPDMRDQGNKAASVNLREHLQAIGAAELQFGTEMDTAKYANSLTSSLEQLSEKREPDQAMRRQRYEHAISAARQLISHIGDQSNLILDPDLDTYYTMSIVILRLPELTTTAVELAEAAEVVGETKSGDRVAARAVPTD